MKGAAQRNERNAVLLIYNLPCARMPHNPLHAPQHLRCESVPTAHVMLCPLIRTRCRKEETTTWAQCERSVTLTRALRARAAGPQSGLFSCVAAARAACVISTCQTLSGPLPQSGSPAREARGAAAAAPQGARGKPLLEGDASVR